MIKLVIADDHDLIIEGLRVLLEHESGLEIVGCAYNGEQALGVIDRTLPQILLTDIEMPQMDGMELTKKVRASYPETKVLVLTMYDEIALAREILQAGAQGYLLKNAGREEVITAIRTVMQGGQYLSDVISQEMLRSFVDGKVYANDGSADLSPRERQIVQLIAKGLHATQIGEQLHISPHTVDTHRKNIYLKLNVHNTAALVHYAMKHGLID